MLLDLVSDLGGSYNTELIRNLQVNYGTHPTETDSRRRFIAVSSGR